MSQEMNFIDYPRKIYKRTFLDTVFVVLSYSINQMTEELISSINQFLRENFNAQENITKDLFDKGFSIDNEEKGFSYFFSSHYLGVKYFKDDYVSFHQTMMPLFYPLMAFLKNIVFVKMVSKLFIRKANIWTIKQNSNNKYDEINLINTFLSTDLVSQAHSYNPAVDDNLRDAHRLIGKTDSFEFDILYGLRDSKLSETDQYVGLVLFENVQVESLPISEMETILLSMNNTLYNIFHWSVSKKTLAYMSQEE